MKSFSSEIEHIYIIVLAFLSQYMFIVADNLELTILHHNDILGHYASHAFESMSSTCDEWQREQAQCIGGLPRIRHIVEQYRNATKAGHGPHTLYLLAGNIFTGSIWHRIHTWRIAADFMNLLKPDAIALGISDFQLKVEGLSRYLENLQVPVIAANLDVIKEPTLQKIARSVVLNVGGIKVGIVGYVTPKLMYMPHVGNILAHNILREVKLESERLTEEGVGIIIALGSDSLEVDTLIARNLTEIDLVIGGFDGILFYNGIPPIMSKEAVDGYPKMVTRYDGTHVPVVQTAKRTSFLGRLNMVFDIDGNVITVEGQPIFLSSDLTEDPEGLKLIASYQSKVDELRKTVVGHSTAYLQGNRTICAKKECNLVNMICDAMVEYLVKHDEHPSEYWTNYAIAITNTRGIFTDINPLLRSGQITVEDIMTAIPFENEVRYCTITGDILYKILRTSASTSYRFLQYSGIRIEYDMKQPRFKRVVSVKVRCSHCEVPEYYDLDTRMNFNVVTSDFLLYGPRGYEFLAQHSLECLGTGKSMSEVTEWYTKTYSPVFPEEESRISFVTKRGKESDGTRYLISFSFVDVVFFFLFVIL